MTSSSTAEASNSTIRRRTKLGLVLEFACVFLLGLISASLYSNRGNRDSSVKNVANEFEMDAESILDNVEGIQDGLSTYEPLLARSRGIKDCLNDKKYSKTTAKTAFEMPFAALFQDTKGEKKFEASGLIKVDNQYYAVCDNSWAISKFDASLTPFDSKNIQIGNPNRESDDSGYEAIIHHNQTFYVVRESVKYQDSRHSNSTCYHAVIEELTIFDDESDYNIEKQCRCEFRFEGDSKGFEGAIGMPGTDGEFYILGLCEGNHCSESKKFDKGNGQMVLMKKNATTTSSNENCIWETVKVISIPKTADFRDYSDVEVTSSGKTVITTQEDSAFWIGQLGGVENGMIDPDKLKFDEDVSTIYSFPKSDECHSVYCNVEGVTFINDNMIMAVSDKMKSKGKQPFWCLEKDQSIHAFVLP
mmetsp:Transcript_20277/g.23498  ORF Transcript_20277/g.23498 Transcript_20277/m.23498 type:complete len:417 (+) Transcript_20277:2-1252(+)